MLRRYEAELMKSASAERPATAGRVLRRRDSKGAPLVYGGLEGVTRLPPV